MEIDREAALPLTADDALPQTREIASTGVLEFEELAVRTGLSGDEAQALIDRPGTRADIEQAARSLKAKILTGESEMIRKLKDGKYRLYSRKKDEKTAKRRKLGTFETREAEKHEREVQYSKRR